MKNIFYLLIIIFFLSTCKKDDEIYTIKNATVITPPTPDTTFTFTVYPNPCDSFIYLQIKFPRASTLKISIDNIVGQLVYQLNVTFQLAAGQNMIGLDVHSLQSGIYFVICEYDSGKVIKKMIKQ